MPPRPLIPALFGVSSPLTICWLVIAVIVNALNSHSLWAGTHIFKEILKTSPTVTNRYPTPTVIFEANNIRIIAATDHRFPYSVQKRASASVSPVPPGGHFLIKAATRAAPAAAEMATENHFPSTAIATTFPGNHSPAGRQCYIAQTSRHQAAKPSPSQINRFLDWGAHETLIHQAPSGIQYPPECCGGRDCKPVACEELTETKDGIKYKSYTFTKGQIRPSQDGECHVCTWESIYGIQGWCVFILPSS